MESIHCGVVPELHRRGSFVLELRTKLESVKSKRINSPVEKGILFLAFFFFVSIYLFVGAGGHVRAHVEMSRRVNKHHLEITVEFCQTRLREETSSN